MNQDQPKTYHLEELKLGQLRQELLRNGLAKFQQKYPSAFLILIAQAEPDIDLDDKRSSTTSSLADITQEEPIEKNEGVETKNEICYAVGKSTQNNFTSKITVGRAYNNDIVLNVKSVSQVHAAFFQDQKDWMLVDMGSTNGTKLNDRRLDNNEQIKVTSSDIVSFASLSFQFMTWSDFHKLLMED